MLLVLNLDGILQLYPSVVVSIVNIRVHLSHEGFKVYIYIRNSREDINACSGDDVGDKSRCMLPMQVLQRELLQS